jgi:hypothetical protein
MIGIIQTSHSMMRCDGCLKATVEPIYLPCGYEKVAQIRKRAKESGWARKRLNGEMLDICPACLKLLNLSLQRGSHFRSI